MFQMGVYESNKETALVFSDQVELNVEYSSKQLLSMMAELHSIQV